MLQDVTDAIVNQLEAAFARIWTLNHAEQVLELQASSGLYTHIDGPHGRVPVGAFKIGLIAQERLPHLTNDVAHDPRVGDRQWAQREGMVSFAGYPLMLDERVVGVMALFARTPLADDTLGALASIADVVALGIERKRSDAALRSSEARHRLFAEATREGIWFWDIKANTVEWNDALLGMLGIGRKDWGGTFADFFQLVHPDDQPRLEAALRNHLEGGAPYDIDWFRLRTSTGDYRIYRTRGKAERDARGAPVAMAGGVLDITEQVRAERALRESEHRYAQILDSVQDMVFCKSPQSAVVYANKATCQHYGMSAEQLRGLTDVAYNDPKNTAQYVRDDVTVFREGTTVEVLEEPNLRADGELRYFHTIKSPIFDTDGQVVELVGVARDVTDRKRAEDDRRFLSEASVLLASSLDYEETLKKTASLAVPKTADWCVVDILQPDGSLQRLAAAHVDPAKVALAEELHRRWPASAQDAHGPPAVVRSGRSELIADISDELLVAIARDPDQLRIVRQLGLRSSLSVPLIAHGTVLGALTLVSAESRRRYTPADVALAEDLARRAATAIENARLYAEVRALNESLERRVEERTRELKEANRELEAFSYTISHDLRAPARHISGFVDLLTRNSAGSLDEKGQRYLTTIGDAAREMGQLVDALLSFSRMGRTQLVERPVSLDEIVGDLIRELEPDVADRQISWQVGALPEVTGDPAMLRLVMANLIGNAVKYTRERPRARIEISRLPSQHPGLHADEIGVLVRDDGVGFKMEYAHKLFGVFQRLHPSYEGTGIGLATVRRVVHRHGGRTWADSREGAGATFFFTLPRSRERSPA